MRRCRISRHFLSLGVIFAAAPGIAHAGDAEPETIQISLDGPPECPDREGLAREVIARTRLANLVGKGSAASTRVFSVRLRPQADQGWLGTLEVRAAGGSDVSLRDTSGAHCAEVVSALGLMIALAVDPNARASADSLVPPSEKSDSLVPPSVRARERPITVGLQAMGLFAAGPTPAWGGVAFAEIGWATGALFAPSLRISGWFAQATRRDFGVITSAGEPSAQFSWYVGRLGVCPLRFDLRSGLAVRPCLGLDAGVLAARGSGVPEQRDEVRLWWTLDAILRFSWVSRYGLGIELEGGVMGLMTPKRYVFLDPPAEVYSLPAWGGFAGVGLVYVF